MPPGVNWNVSVMSPERQWNLLAMAIGLGGHVPVGVEDNPYLSPGSLPDSRPPGREGGRLRPLGDRHRHSRRGARHHRPSGAVSSPEPTKTGPRDSHQAPPLRRTPGRAVDRTTRATYSSDARCTACCPGCRLSPSAGGGGSRRRDGAGARSSGHRPEAPVRRSRATRSAPAWCWTSAAISTGSWSSIPLSASSGCSQESCWQPAARAAAMGSGSARTPPRTAAARSAG